MTLRELYNESLARLSETENADNELRFIFKKVLCINDTDFILKQRDNLTQSQIDSVKSMVDERLDGRPLQYILGEWDFCGLTFNVSEGVLIPRPETELLCNYILDYISDFKDTPYVADLCSGSGCIGLTIKHFRPDTYINLFEKSMDAYECLVKNCRKICPDECVIITMGDIFCIESYEALPKFDVIVSNPPYIKSADIPTLQSEVRYEPEMALDGGEDGMIFYRFITKNWIRFLKDDGLFAFECGEGQAEEIKQLLENNNFSVKILKDYRDVDRFVIGKRLIV